MASMSCYSYRICYVSEPPLTPSEAAYPRRVKSKSMEHELSSLSLGNPWRTFYGFVPVHIEYSALDKCLTNYPFNVKSLS